MTHEKRIRWEGVWVSSFDIGPYMNAYQDGRYVARVFDCRRLAGLDIAPHPSGRQRRQYLALICVGETPGIVGVHKSLRAAKREVERYFPAIRLPSGLTKQSPIATDTPCDNFVRSAPPCC